MKLRFTKVSEGVLLLQNAMFLEGCTGRNLDLIARKPLWDINMDYKHGTGHGIGYMLNVHEGPQGIRWKYNEAVQETILEPGMMISNEPGVYVEGKYGIRIENIMLCEEKVKNQYGQFLGFKPLTLVPIDVEAIDKSNMSDEGIRLLNDYHQLVYQEINTFLTKEEQIWLKEVTKPI